jgi:hypothetical protein
MTEASLFKDYHTLFSRFFIENCEIDQEHITDEEANALNELDANEVFENFSDLVSQLLKFKKNCITSDQAELIKKCNSFEALIQKLENEVRTHIGVEHQLKLLLENFQSKIQGLEKTNQELTQRLTEQELVMKSQRVKPSKSTEREEKVKEKLRVLHKRTKSDCEDIKNFARTGKIEAKNKVVGKKIRVSIVDKVKAKAVKSKHLRSSSDLIFKGKIN